MTTKKFECNACGVPCTVEVTNIEHPNTPEKCIYHSAVKYCEWVEVDLSNAESRLKTLEYGLQLQAKLLGNITYSYDAELIKMREVVRAGIDERLSEIESDGLDMAKYLSQRLTIISDIVVGVHDRLAELTKQCGEGTEATADRFMRIDGELSALEKDIRDIKGKACNR